MSEDNNPYQTPGANVDSPMEQPDLALHEPRRRPVGHGGRWVAEGWQLFKQEPVAWVGMFLIWMVISVVISLLPIISIFGTLLTTLFMGGWMAAAALLDREGVLKVEYLFRGFQQNFSQLLIAGLIYFGLTIGLFVVLALVFIVGMGMDPAQLVAMEENPERMMNVMGAMMVLVLLFALMFIPVVMLVWFAPALIILHDVPAWRAMTQSFKGCLKNVLSLSWWALIVLVLSILGMIPLFLGLLVVAPLTMISMYSSYKDIYVADD